MIQRKKKFKIKSLIDQIISEIIKNKLEFGMLSYDKILDSNRKIYELFDEECYCLPDLLLSINGVNVVRKYYEKEGYNISNMSTGLKIKKLKNI